MIIPMLSINIVFSNRKQLALG